jgi:hypothetical protein
MEAVSVPLQHRANIDTALTQSLVWLAVCQNDDL